MLWSWDAGAGTRFVTSPSAAHNELWGIDLSPVQIAFAEETLSPFAPRVRLIESPIEVDPGVPWDLDKTDLPEWERESLLKVRAALESGDFLALPDKFEIHEWAIMERFSRGQARATGRDELLDAIHGAGAFRSFRSAIRRLGIEDDWFRFRQAEYEEIAKDWLEAHDISFR